MKVFKSKKGLALLATLAVAVMASVGAYAYFVSSGTGAGTGTVGSLGSTTNNFKVTQTAFGSDFYPGAAAQALAGSVQNLDLNSPVALHTIAVTIDAPTGGAGPNCTTADFDWANAGSGWNVVGKVATYTSALPVELDKKGGANDTTTFSGVKLAMNDLNSNQNDCQGAQINLSYAVN